MNKSDLAEKLALQLPHLSRREIDLILDTVFDKMSTTLGSGQRIEIRGFGSFEVRTRPAREGRNPKTGEKVFVETRRVPFFKVGKELKAIINDEDTGVDEKPQKKVSSA